MAPPGVGIDANDLTINVKQALRDIIQSRNEKKAIQLLDKKQIQIQAIKHQFNQALKNKAALEQANLQHDIDKVDKFSNTLLFMKQELEQRIRDDM